MSRVNIWKFYKIGILAIIVAGNISSCGAYEAAIEVNDEGWTKDFNTENRTFSSIGRQEFFILEPGYQLTLEGKEDEDNIILIVTVLNETEMVGSVETRVVEERELENGELIEISRNFFAMCVETKSVFYFGEDVEMYEDGKLVSHEGEWRADGDNKAGVMMPGIILLGSKYYQEYAPGKAMDRAEIVRNDVTLQTPAGTFEHCLKINENNPLEGESEFKIHAPGIGLIRDEDLFLTSYGFIPPFKPIEPTTTTEEPTTITTTVTTTATTTATTTVTTTATQTTTVPEMNTSVILSALLGLVMGVWLFVEIRKRRKLR